MNRSDSSLLVLFGTYLDIPAEPPQHLFPICNPLARLWRASMPRAWCTHELNGNLPHQLQSYIHLLRLRNRTAQIVFGMNEEGRSGDICCSSNRRALTIIGGPFRIPGSAFRLPYLPESDIRA